MKIIKPSLNYRAYLATCLRHFAQILLRRTSDTLKPLNKVSNSPNLNIFYRGLASFKYQQEEIQSIASQPGIITVKRLRTAKTQIFNNRGEGELYSAIRIVNSFLEDVDDIKRRHKHINGASNLIDLIKCHRKEHYAFASRIIREDMRDEIHTCQRSTS